MNLVYESTPLTETERGHRAIFLRGDGKRFALSTLDNFPVLAGINQTETVFIEIGEDDDPVEGGIKITLDRVGDFDEAVKQLELVISGLPEPGTLKFLRDRELVEPIPLGSAACGKQYLNYKGETWVLTCVKDFPDSRTGLRSDTSLFSLTDTTGDVPSEREGEFMFVEGIGDPDEALAHFGFKVA